jgi:RNA methyltransferase, TrmH family
MITSTRNPKIQWVRSLQSRAQARREEGLFIVEGVRLVEEALNAGWDARLLLYTDDLANAASKSSPAFPPAGSRENRSRRT